MREEVKNILQGLKLIKLNHHVFVSWNDPTGSASNTESLATQKDPLFGCYLAPYLRYNDIGL